MNFNPFTEQELQQYCQEKGLQCTADVLRASCGAPGRLQYLLDDAKSSKEIAAALVKLEVAQTSGVADRMLLISELAELENDQLCDILTVWLHRQRSRLAERPEQGKLMNQICHSLESLQGTFNKKLKGSIR
jgi:acetyl-CoA carboxylase alpha subunit